MDQGLLTASNIVKHWIKGFKLKVSENIIRVNDDYILSGKVQYGGRGT